MKISEILNSPYEFDLGNEEYGESTAVTILPDGSKLRTTFRSRIPGIYSVEFSKNYSFYATNDGDAYKIFATVLATIAQFIKKVQPDVLRFISEKSDSGKNNGRDRLYNKLVNKYAASVGYIVERTDQILAIEYRLIRRR